jgi:hypothetical protein
MKLLTIIATAVIAASIMITHHSAKVSATLPSSGVTCEQVRGYVGGMSLADVQKKAILDGSPVSMEYLPGSDSTYQVQIGLGDAFNGVGKQGYRGPIVRIGFTERGSNANKALISNVYNCGGDTGFVWYP